MPISHTVGTCAINKFCDYVIWPDARAEIWPKECASYPGIVAAAAASAAADKFLPVFCLAGRTWPHLDTRSAAANASVSVAVNLPLVHCVRVCVCWVNCETNEHTYVCTHQHIHPQFSINNALVVGLRNCCSILFCATCQTKRCNIIVALCVHVCV